MSVTATKLSAFHSHYDPKIQYCHNAISSCKNLLQSESPISDQDAVKMADQMAMNFPRTIPFRLEHRFKAVEDYADFKDAITRLIRHLEVEIQYMEQLLGEIAEEER